MSTADKKLSPAEHRVVNLVIDGYSNGQIAKKLKISEQTVKSHLTNAYARLGMRSRAQLIAQAMRESKAQVTANDAATYLNLLLGAPCNLPTSAIPRVNQDSSSEPSRKISKTLSKKDKSENGSALSALVLSLITSISIAKGTLATLQLEHPSDWTKKLTKTHPEHLRMLLQDVMAEIGRMEDTLSTLQTQLD